jgi:cysteine desulfurase / selenocysteine lyase
MAFDVEMIRSDFPLLSRKVDGKKIAYLDNAATTQKPRAVLEAMKEYYENTNANPHRAGHALAEEAGEAYETARKKVAGFIGAKPEEIVFTKNTTESLNFVARMACGKRSSEKILLTEMEHHSNIVSWQLASRGAGIEYAKMRSHGKLCVDDVEKKLNAHPAVFSFAHASNVLGTVNGAALLCRMARKRGALTCIDAAQSAPHMKIDVRGIGCDFLAFSAHKMLGPTGVGVLYIRKGLADTLEPVFGGGGMIESVSRQNSTWARPPWKFEAGTQDAAGAVGTAAAVDYIEKIGMAAIERHTAALYAACIESLGSVPEIRFHGNGKKTGIVSFNVGKIHAHDIGEFASQEGVMIRAGHHCAQPLMGVLGEVATARASVYLYNTEQEAERLAESVNRAARKLG